MKGDTVLPAFELDCRDWVVVRPEEAGFPAEFDDAPMLAMLCSAIVDGEGLGSITAILTLGLVDADSPPAISAGAGCVAAEILDLEPEVDTSRFLLPAPDGQLAVLAEFRVSGRVEAEAERRIDALMRSFRWAA